MEDPAWQIEVGASPLVAAAIHDGRIVRPEIAKRLALDEQSRLREEDPYTATWTSIADTRIIVRRSRFEVDLNRPRDKAVYRVPADAWGLQVWKSKLPAEIIERSLTLYDTFYAEMYELLQGLIQRTGRIVVFDLHSYNHRRSGPGHRPTDPQGSPEVNLGTATMMDRNRWAPIIERFISEMRHCSIFDHQLDVRENVKFHGGNFPRWIHTTFPETACVLSIEVKKFFMDEWSGQPHFGQIDAIGRALGLAAGGVLEELRRL